MKNILSLCVLLTMLFFGIVLYAEDKEVKKIVADDDKTASDKDDDKDKDDEDEKEKKLDHKKLREQFSDSLVRVWIYLPKEKKDKEETTSRDDGYSRYSSYGSSSSFRLESWGQSEQTLQNFRDERLPLKTTGIVVGADGLVMIMDPQLVISDYERIDIKFLNGEVHSAELQSYAVHYPVIFVKIKEAAKQFKAVDFVDVPELNLDSHFSSVRLSELEGDWYFSVGGGGSPRAEAKEQKSFRLHVSHGNLLVNTDGEAFGVATHSIARWDPDGKLSFDGKAIMADQRLTVEQMTAQLERAEEHAEQMVWELKLEIRGQDNDRDDLERTYDMRRYGILLDDKGTIFLPYNISSKTIQKLNKTTIEIDGNEVEANYRGSFLEFGGLIFECKDLAGRKPFPIKHIDDFRIDEAYFSLATTYKFGKKHPKATLNRVYRYSNIEATAYDPAYRYPDVMQMMFSGEFLVNQDMAIVGFRGKEKIEQKKAGAGARRDPWSSSYGSSTQGKYKLKDKLFTMKSIAEQCKDSSKYFDPEAVLKTKTEIKRLLWVGVEYQSVGYNLAKYLEIQGFTKNGKQGLLLTGFFEDSPAQRAGFQQDDIMLSYTVKSNGKKQELNLQNSRGYYGRGYGRSAGRRNYLTALLTEVGVDEVLEFDVLRGKEEIKISVTLEQAPRDQDSAEKYKSKALGFTAKDLTYEIRKSLKLSTDHKGVIIADVDSGGRLEVAELYWGVLESINNKEVTGVEQLRTMLASLKETKARTLTFFVRQFDETHFFEVQTGWANVEKKDK